MSGKDRTVDTEKYSPPKYFQILQDIMGDLAVTQFTDTHTTGNAFYRGVAKP